MKYAPYIVLNTKGLLASGVLLSPGDYVEVDDERNQHSSLYNYYFHLTLSEYREIVEFDIEITPYLLIYDQINQVYVENLTKVPISSFRSKIIGIPSGVDLSRGDFYYIFSQEVNFTKIRIRITNRSGIDLILNQVWRESI